MAIDRIAKHYTSDDVKEHTWPQWVTAYEMTRHYGGPEEGGWYYDAWECLASIPCLTVEDVNDAIDRLKEIWFDLYETQRSRYSVIGEEDLQIAVESEKGTDGPAERPHYE